ATGGRTTKERTPTTTASATRPIRSLDRAGWSIRTHSSRRTAGRPSGDRRSTTTNRPRRVGGAVQSMRPGDTRASAMLAADSKNVRQIALGTDERTVYSSVDRVVVAQD